MRHNNLVLGLNRHQGFIHSVTGFKKTIYKYTNQEYIDILNCVANEGNLTVWFTTEISLYITLY